MRIGLVLFGNLRSYRKTIDSFLEFRNLLMQIGKVDVFCHTWDIEESVTASWWKEHKPGDTSSATVNAKEIEEKYKPVKYIIESSRQFDDSEYDIKSAIPIAGILSMLHSQQQAFRLLEQYSSENNITYDVVIKCRYDLLYETVPAFSNAINDCITNNCLYLPTSNPYELGGSFSDVFALGPVKLVKEYFSFAENFKTAAGHYQQKGYKEFLPELCLTLYLIEKRIAIRELTGLHLHILRMNGDTFQINTDMNFTGNHPLCFFRDTIQLNKRILPSHNLIIKTNSEKLVRKYMSWVNKEADTETLNQYAELYNGNWIGVSRVRELAAKGKDNPMFKSNVMKNFFEEAMRNAKYGQFKKILLASVLAASSGYGFFFLRVLKKISYSRN